MTYRLASCCGARRVTGTTMLGSAVLYAMLSGPSEGQQGSQGRQQPTFKVVDQGVADRNDLSTSLRVPFQDLRLPMNFDDLYEVDPSYMPGGLRSSSGFYARAHAGIVAVYPRSVYNRLAPGVEQVAIPPGTVYIFADSAMLTGQSKPRFVTRSQQASLLQRLEAGDVSAPLTPDPAFTQPGGRATAGLLARLAAHNASDGDGDAERARADDGSVIATIWHDEPLRQHRVEVLLDAALRKAPQ